MDAPVTPQATRRALARAERGATLDVAEAAVLLAARGDDLEALCRTAARVRDAGLEAAGRPGVVTYSPKVFIPLTRLCRDRCHYCTFVTTPNKLAAAGQSPYLSPDEVAGDRPAGRRPRLQGGAVHARRPARGPLAGGGAVARRARLRLHARLPPGDGGPGARGDRAAAPPQPRRPVLGGDRPAQAGRAVAGHDAGDHLDPAVHREGPGPLRLPRQGPGGAAAGARGRRAAQRAVHDRDPGRHRREPDRAGRVALRDPQGGPAVRRRAGGDRAELPGQAGHRHANLGGPRPRGVPRHDRRRPHRARAEDARAGPAEPGRPRRVHRPARRRRRRLGRGLPAHPRPREPRAALALPRAAPLGDRGRRLRPRRAAHRAPGVRARRRAVARPAGQRPRRRARHRRRARPPRRTPHRSPLAGARRRLRAHHLHRPHRPPRVHRHRRPHLRPPRRLRLRLRRLGPPPRAGSRPVDRRGRPEPGGGGRGGRARRRRGPGRGRPEPGGGRGPWTGLAAERGTSEAGWTRARFGARSVRLRTARRRHPGRTGGRRERPAGPHRRPGAHPDDRRRRGPPRGGPDRRRPAPRRGR